MATECTTKRCSLCMRIGQPLSVTRRSREYVHRTISRAPFEGVVLPRWTKELCSYCDAFVEGGWRRKKHTLHMIIDYVMSGSRRSAPSKMHQPQLLRWISDLDAENPIMLQLIEFKERLQAIRNLDPLLGESSICMVRWLFEGGSRLFSDMDLGRNIRRQSPQRVLVSACRRCCGPSNFGGYSSVMLGGLSDFADVVERPPIAPGLTSFCFRCRAVTAISFEYHTALREALGLPPSQLTCGGYYARIAALHRRDAAEFSE